MKNKSRYYLVGALLPFYYLFKILSRRLHIRGFMSICREAYWKTQLGYLVKETSIYPSVVIHNPENVHIGSRCSIVEFVHMWGGGGIKIGNNVMIASQAIITSLTHDRSACCRYRDTLVRAPVVIEDNAWIGSGAIILPGITVGSCSIVGAGAVVTHDVPPYTVVAGVPAKAIGKCQAQSID